MSNYTVVQHSAWGRKRDPQFERGLESRAVTKAQEKKVLEAGGVVLPGYVEAEDFADAAMYPDGKGLIPHAEGTFSRAVIDGLRIYIPAKEQS